MTDQWGHLSLLSPTTVPGDKGTGTHRPFRGVSRPVLSQTLAGRWAGASWQAIAHMPRTIRVVCVSCGEGALNESNGLHRAGWQETRTAPRAFRCGDCAVAS